MKILFVTTLGYPPQSAGGSKSSTHDLCTILKAKGHDVAVLCSVEPGGLLGLGNRIKRRVFPSYKFPVDHVVGYPVFRGWDPVAGVPEVVQRFKPDVAVVQAGQSVSISKALIAVGIPTVLYLRDVEFDKIGGELFEDKLLNYIANSSFTALAVYNRFGVNAQVVPPLVIPERYITHTTRKNVLHINPHPMKGIEITLELAKRRQDIIFNVIESWSVGPDVLGRYKAIADSLPNVFWHKRIHDMRKIYCHARIVLAPSQCEEAWGRIATEAHINGIPVIASDLGGFPESVGPGGLLVASDAPMEKWECALSSLWDDPDLYAQYVEASFLFSKRKEILPESLISRFTDILNEHIAQTKN